MGRRAVSAASSHRCAALRPAPGSGNVWQLLPQDSALVSVTASSRLLRQGADRRRFAREPFQFFMSAAALDLVITSMSGAGPP